MPAAMWRALLLPWLLLALCCVERCRGMVVSGSIATEVALWFADVSAMYELSVNASVAVNLTAADSADTIAALLAGTVDFAIATTALTAAQAAAQPNITALPMMATAFAPMYRLDALNASVPLILSGRTLALIYAGNVTNWNDTLIQDDNPGRSMPDQNITVCYQSDRIASTLVFLTALNKFEPSIASILPPSALPAWPVDRYAASMPGTQLLGVVSNVVSNDGAIGFNSLPACITNHASVASMINRAGNVIAASYDSITYTFDELLLPTALDELPDLTDPAGEHGWPIVASAYLLLDSEASPRGCDVRRSVVDYWRWYYTMMRDYEPILTAIGIVSLPPILQRSLNVSSVLAANITCDGQAVDSSAAASSAAPIAIYGTSRLAHAVSTAVQFRASAAAAQSLSMPSFDFVPELSAAAAQLGQQTNSLALFYTNELATNATAAVNRTDYYLLPMFLTSIALTFNPQLSETVHIHDTQLVIDFDTIGLLLLQNITDWHDPHILALNPQLATMLDDKPAPITFTVACQGNSPLLNAYITALLQGLAASNQPLYAALKAFITDPTTELKFSRCEQVMERVPLIYSPLESTMPALAQNTPGAIGYGFGNAATWSQGILGLRYPSHNGTVRRPTAEGLLACAAAMDFDADTLELKTGSVAAWSQADCWPVTQTVYAQVPKAYQEDMRDAGLAALQLLQWFNNDSALDPWANSNLLVRTAQLPLLQSSILSTLQSITCDDETLLITLPDVWQVKQPLVYSVIAIAVLGGSFALVALYIVLLNRVHGAFRSASPLFMAVSLVGVLAAFVCAALLVATPSARVCSAVNWTGQLAFTLVFTPLLAKTYRIYRIFGRQRLKVVRLTNNRLFAAVCALVALDVAMLSGWQAVAPMDAVTTARFSSEDGDRVGETVYTQCSYTGAAQKFFIGEVVVKTLLLIAGVLLAFSTRQVTEAFNESKSIGFAIYNIVVAIALIAPIIVTVDAIGDTLVILVAFCLLWISCFTLAVLFMPKLLSFLDTNRAASAGAKNNASSETPYEFVGLNQFATAAAVQSYLTAVEAHTGEVKRRMNALKRVEQGFSQRGELSRTTASRPQTAHASLNSEKDSDTDRGRGKSSTSSDGMRGSLTLMGLRGWKSNTVVPASATNTNTATPLGRHKGSINSLPPLMLPMFNAAGERVERPSDTTDSPPQSSTHSLGSCERVVVTELGTPDNKRTTPLGMAVCELDRPVRPSTHRTRSMEGVEVGSPTPVAQVVPPLVLPLRSDSPPTPPARTSAQLAVDEAGM